MLRLVWKDVVAAYWVLPGAVVLYLVQLITTTGVPVALLAMTLVFTALFAFGPIGVDEIQGTEMLWCSLPVGRRDIVLARYLAVLLGILLGLAPSWLAARVALVWASPGAEAGSVPVGAGSYAALFCLLLLSATLFLPCYFRLGAGRGLLLFLVLALGGLVALSALGSAALYLAGGADAVEALRRADPAELYARAARWRAAAAVAGPLVALALYAGSATLSVRFYQQRDC